MEISYHNLHISPLILQDDCNRCTLTVSEAQEVNNRFEQCVQPKLLDFNTDKSCFVITGPKTGQNRLRQELISTPLTLYGVKLNEKLSEKYHGDLIHTAGVSESAHLTVLERSRQLHTKISEARTIVEDCRSLVLVGSDIWEMAILLSLLTN